MAALMILWANLHSTFVLGLILFYIVVGFGCFRQMRSGNTDNLKWISFVTVLVTLAALATPYGILFQTHTWTIMGMHFALAHIQEWQPPNFRQSPIHLAYVISLFAVMTGFGLKLPGAPCRHPYGNGVAGNKLSARLLHFRLDDSVPLCPPSGTTSSIFQPAKL